MRFLGSFFGVGAPSEASAPAPYIAPLLQRDFVAAVPLLKAAILLEDAQAMGLLGALSALGHGVEKNAEDACAWFRQAAVRSHVPSQAALGLCLANGLGTPRDHKEAAYWLYKAGQAGNQTAIEALGTLAYKDNSVVGPHFTETELCDLVMQLRKRPARNKSPPPASRLH